MRNAVITRRVLATVIGILRGPALPNTVVDGLIQPKLLTGRPALIDVELKVIEVLHASV